MDYDFTFVVTGVTVQDQAAVDTLRDELDALLAQAGGCDLLTMTWPGDSAVDAALQAVSAAKAAVPRLCVTRLDRDLVGVPEIAERTGRSRQNVSQWVAGERKGTGEPFPIPEGTVGRSNAWLWTDVNGWLGAHGLDDGANYPSRAEMTEIDFALANMVTLSFRSAESPGFEKGRKAVIEELHSKHIPGFLSFLTRLDGTTDELGNHVLVVADQGESARGVMEFVSSFDHDVVLVTTMDEFMATVLSTRAPSGPRAIVAVPEKATVRDWLRLVQENPRSAFTMAGSEAEVEKAAPIQRVMAIAA